VCVWGGGGGGGGGEAGREAVMRVGQSGGKRNWDVEESDGFRCPLVLALLETNLQGQSAGVLQVNDFPTDLLSFADFLKFCLKCVLYLDR